MFPPYIVTQPVDSGKSAFFLGVMIPGLDSWPTPPQNQFSFSHIARLKTLAAHYNDIAQQIDPDGREAAGDQYTFQITNERTGCVVDGNGTPLRTLPTTFWRNHNQASQARNLAQVCTELAGKLTELASFAS